jgi:hypothetical protein
MKTFQEYIDEAEQAPVDSKQDLFNKIINICLEKYPDEIDDFLSVVSSKDENIREIVEKIKELNNKFKEPDIISPNIADDNHGNGNDFEN